MHNINTIKKLITVYNIIYYVMNLMASDQLKIKFFISNFKYLNKILNIDTYLLTLFPRDMNRQVWFLIRQGIHGISAKAISITTVSFSHT